MQYWNNKFPEAVQSGQVCFQGSLSIRYCNKLYTLNIPNSARLFRGSAREGCCGVSYADDHA